MAGEAIFEIGRRILKVHSEKLAERRGGWTSWLRDIDVSTSQADRFMKVAMELDGKFPTSGSLKLGTLYEIATLSPEQREQHHTLKSGETKTVDEMTVRELREVKKALKEAEAKAQQAEIARRDAEIKARQLARATEPTYY